MSRFDSTVTSDTKESGKTVRADFLPQCVFADDSDSGECEDDDCTPENFVHGFNYVDPRLIAEMKESSKNVEAKIVDLSAKNRT